ncbi:MAG: cytidylate kinase-like family protein [Agathobacter sp.]|nr:cytidylate kinase-like family protein [Agathobacter sp.]
MGKQLIISVGREFGSGGHEIAEKLANHYGLQMLDHNLLDEIAAERQYMNADEVRHLDEKHNTPFFSRTVRGFSSSPQENISLMQFDYLQKKAAKGDSFVIVGRCSEDVLKEYDSMVSIFILGDRKVKRERIMNLYNLPENLAERLMNEKDMKRKRYHNGFCKGKWGDSRNYDISVNSSVLGIDETVEILIDFIDKKVNM